MTIGEEQVVVGNVGRLARYPVKSLRGQWCDRLRVTWGGVEFDRALAIYGWDGKIASGKNTRRFRRMPNLFAMRSWADGDTVWLETPDGSTYHSDDAAGWMAVSQVLGEAVEIRVEAGTPHKDDAPIHVITTASLRWAASLRTDFDAAPERYRPNIVIEADGVERIEEHWVGRRLQIGDCVLRVTKRTERCVMPALAQQNLPFLPGLLRALTEHSEASLGVYAEVMSPGELAVGAPVALLA